MLRKMNSCVPSWTKSVSLVLLVASSVVDATIWTNSTASPDCQLACAALQSAFGDARLHYPDNDNFTIWDAKQQEVRPACRVEPSNAVEVASILNVVVDHWCRFAVKGGGHSRTADDSNSVGGVTIDLNRISSVEVTANATRARVGGGAQSAQIYEALEAHNLGYVGGRVGTVGIGGHALGGGSSPFANRHGWLLDNVYEYEVVLSNGTITTVSENYHPDLYWALRGGGNNFGIVTTFVIRVFPQGPIYQSASTYAPNQTEQVLDRVYDLWTDPSLFNDLDQAYDMYYGYNTTTGEFRVSGTQRYLIPTTNPAVFNEIDQIPTTSRTTRINTMSNLASNPPSGVTRNLFGTLTISPSRELFTRAYQVFREEVSVISTVEGLSTNFIAYPIHQNAISAMTRRGGNALGISQSDEPLILIFISTAWTNASADSAIWDMTRNVVNRVESIALDLGVANRFKYINYAWAGQADEVFAGYGQDNADRLRAIQRAVDPRGIFTLRGLWRGFMKLL